MKDFLIRKKQNEEFEKQNAAILKKAWDDYEIPNNVKDIKQIDLDEM